jgi:hypothetical protein
MAKHVYYNPNPTGKSVGDCAIRAIAKTFDLEWGEAFLGLCIAGYLNGDLPNANHIWGAYLKKRGFRRHMIPCEGSDCYTVKQFCEAHPIGIYVLSLSGHVLCVCDGDWYDSWDSGSEIVQYYWENEQKG